MTKKEETFINFFVPEQFSHRYSLVMSHFLCLKRHTAIIIPIIANKNSEPGINAAGVGETAGDGVDDGIGVRIDVTVGVTVGIGVAVGVK